MENRMPSSVKRAITTLWLTPVALCLAIMVGRISGWTNTRQVVVFATMLVLYPPLLWLLRRRTPFARFFIISFGGWVSLLFLTGFVMSFQGESSPDPVDQELWFLIIIVSSFAFASLSLLRTESRDWFWGDLAPELRDRKFWLMRAGILLFAAGILYGVIWSISIISSNIEDSSSFGLVDLSGTVTLKPIYDDLSIGSDPESIVACRDGKCGYIDRKGHYVIEPKFELAVPFDKSGWAPARQGGKWGYIDRTGNFVIPPKYDAIRSFKTTMLAPVKVNQKWGYIDTTGKLIIEPSYAEAGIFGSTGLAAVKVGAKWGYISQDGALVVEPMYEYARPFNDSGLAVVSTKKKWGYIDATGKFAIEPTYGSAADFDSKGMAFVGVNGKFGYIDRTGQFVIKPQFDEVRSFGDSDLAAAKVNDKWGFIDRTGTFLIEPKYGWIKSSVSAGDRWLAVVWNRRGEVGVIDRTGQHVIPPKYSDINIKVGENGAILIVFSVPKTCLFEKICLP